MFVSHEEYNSVLLSINDDRVRKKVKGMFDKYESVVAEYELTIKYIKERIGEVDKCS
jgi:hypothetical protein